MHFSRISVICCLLAFVACSQARPNLSLGREEALLQTQLLLSKYGECSNAPIRSYLSYLEARLAKAAERGGVLSTANFSFKLLDTLEPVAFSPGGGVLLFSRGLLLNLSNEAELAFVLAHELAHQTLGHTQLLAQSKGEPAAPDLQKLELAADHQALGITALAGYDPHFAVNAVLHAYRAAGIGDTPSSSHPDLQTRINTIRAAIDQAQWQPPGTVNRWEFQHLRLALARM